MPSKPSRGAGRLEVLGNHGGLATEVLAKLDQPADLANFCLASKQCHRLALATPAGSLSVTLWDPSGFLQVDAEKDDSFFDGCVAWLGRQCALGLPPGLPVYRLHMPSVYTLVCTAPALGALRALNVFPTSMGDAAAASAAISRLSGLQALEWGGAGAGALAIAGHPGLQRLLLYDEVSGEGSDDEEDDEAGQQVEHGQRAALCHLPSLQSLEVDYDGPVHLSSGDWPALQHVSAQLSSSLKLRPDCTLPALHTIECGRGVKRMELGAECPNLCAIKSAARAIVLGEDCMFPSLATLSAGFVEGLCGWRFPAMESLKCTVREQVGRYPPLESMQMLKKAEVHNARLALGDGCSLPHLVELSCQDVSLGRGCSLPALQTVRCSGTLTIQEDSSLPSLHCILALYQPAVIRSSLPVLECLNCFSLTLGAGCSLPLQGCHTVIYGIMLGEGCSLPVVTQLRCHSLTLAQGCSMAALELLTCRGPWEPAPGVCNLGEGCSLPSLKSLRCGSLTLDAMCSLPALKSLMCGSLVLDEGCRLPALEDLSCGSLTLPPGSSLPALERLCCDSLSLGNGCSLPMLKNLHCPSLAFGTGCSLPALTLLECCSLTLDAGCSLPALSRLYSNSLTLGAGCELPKLEHLSAKTLMLGDRSSLCEVKLHVDMYRHSVQVKLGEKSGISCLGRLSELQQLMRVLPHVTSLEAEADLGDWPASVECVKFKRPSA